ncbi:MAG: bifunctional oligoribonuclease/PAP phosphatase NrnA [Phycisphaerales bacterium]|nr:bifunctional oligoribonuclease/PAP phosphatase NrnA [Phycisphaerales bacterium]
MKTVVERLKAAKRVAVFTHQRPDPDALGSQAAMGWILRELGASEIFLMQFAEVPRQYRFLVEPPTDKDGKPLWELTPWNAQWADGIGGAVDTILVVDTCTYNQLEPAAVFLKAQREKVLAIDHHLSRDDLAAIILADPKAAACVEILWELAKTAGVIINQGLAGALFAGLVSDTGWFRFDSVTERSHRMAAELTPLVNNAAMYEKLQQNETRPKLGLMERALASLRWGGNDRVACMSLRQQDFTQTGANQSQTEYLVDMPMIVSGVEVVILLTEMTDSRVRGSLRSKRDVDVNKVCRKFDGGGHAKAAGCRLNGPLETARERIMQAVEDELTNSLI